MPIPLSSLLLSLPLSSRRRAAHPATKLLRRSEPFLPTCRARWDRSVLQSRAQFASQREIQPQKWESLRGDAGGGWGGLSILSFQQECVCFLPTTPAPRGGRDLLPKAGGPLLLWRVSGQRPLHAKTGLTGSPPRLQPEGHCHSRWPGSKWGLGCCSLSGSKCEGRGRDSAASRRWVSKKSLHGSSPTVVLLGHGPGSKSERLLFTLSMSLGNSACGVAQGSCRLRKAAVWRSWAEGRAWETAHRVFARRFRPPGASPCFPGAEQNKTRGEALSLSEGTGQCAPMEANSLVPGLTGHQRHRGAAPPVLSVLDLPRVPLLCRASSDSPATRCPAVAVSLAECVTFCLQRHGQHRTAQPAAAETAQPRDWDVPLTNWGSWNPLRALT